MVEINLLPWRQYVRVSKQKRMKYRLISVAFLCLLFFVMMHISFVEALKKINFTLFDLQNQLSDVQSHTTTNDDPFFSTELNKADFSQKRVSALLEKIVRTSTCHIQITKIDYTEKSILWVGYVRSAYAIACWMKAFRHIPIQKFKVETQKGSDLQQFSFVIE